MIKVIAFDLGGVFFTEGKSVLARKLSEKHHYKPEVILGLLKSPESIKLRKGLISDEAFWSWAEKHLPKGYNVQLIKKEWYESYTPDKEIRTIVEKLRGKYTLLIFSDNIKSRVEYLDQKYHFRKLFDIEVYSHDYHLAKPEKDFIKIMIRAAGVKPEEILYIDDKEKNIAAAKSLGIKGIIYSRGEFNKLLEELKEYQITL